MSELCWADIGRYLFYTFLDNSCMHVWMNFTEKHSSAYRNRTIFALFPCYESVKKTLYFSSENTVHTDRWMFNVSIYRILFINVVFPCRSRSGRIRNCFDRILNNLSMSDHFNDRLNMELDLQSLFGLCTRALLVSQDRRHLFVTPWI